MPIANVRSLAAQRTPLKELNLNMLLGGPVLALPMQEGDGGTVYDISGFGNDGTITGAAWVQLPSGLWAMSFDGDGDGITCGTSSSLDITGAISVEAWLILGDKEGPQVICINRNSDKWWFSYDTPVSEKLGVYLGGTTNPGWHSGTANLLRDTPYHVAFTYDLSNIRLYINGALDKTIPDTGSLSAGTALEVAIGSRDTLFHEMLKGIIGLVRIHPRALALLEIQNHFHREKHYFDIYDGNILARLANLRSLAVVR